MSELKKVILLEGAKGTLLVPSNSDSLSLLTAPTAAAKTGGRKKPVKKEKKVDDDIVKTYCNLRKFEEKAISNKWYVTRPKINGKGKALKIKTPWFEEVEIVWYDEEKGFGVIAKEDIPKDSIMAVYGDKYVATEEIKQQMENCKYCNDAKKKGINNI